MNRTLIRTIALATLVTPSAALATNGMNPISFGARSAGMAGADTAVATDTNAMNTNPAGIVQFKHRVDGTLSLLMPKLTLSDKVMTPQGSMDLNPKVEGESKMFPLMALGYAQEIIPNLHAGLGFYVQGGMGAEFKGLNTMSDPNPGADNTMAELVGKTYRTMSEVSFMKFTPTLAYNIKVAPGTDVSLGAALNIGMSKMKFAHSGMQFPEQDKDQMYYAHSVDFESDYATGFAVRVGALARLMEGAMSVGVAYQSKAPLTYKGTMNVDDQMKYDMEAEFGWPQEVAFGIAGRPIKPLLLSADVRWAQWSDPVDTVTFEGKAQGTVPAGYEQMKMPFRMGWNDQVVLAVGAEYEVLPDLLQVRAGYNHGKSPVDGDGINPLFPPTVEDHVTFGLGVEPIKGLAVNAAVEMALENKVASTAKNQMSHQPDGVTPNGYSHEVGMKQTTIHMGVGYEF